MKVKCAGGCGRELYIPKRHQGADRNEYTCFSCNEATATKEKRK